MIKRKSRRASVLKTQKRTHLLPAAFRRSWWKFLVAGSLAALAIGGGHRLYSLAQKSAAKDLGTPNDDEIALERMDGAQMPADTRAAFTKVVRDSLVQSCGDLAASTVAVQKALSLARVSLIRTGPQSVLLRYQEHLPLLVVRADRWRFVSADGAIYGEPDPHEANGMPKISGLLDDRKTYLWEVDNTLQLDPNEKALLLKGLQAYGLGQTQGLAIREVSVSKFRGVTVTDRRGMEISLGTTNFEEKFQHLRTIMSDVTKRGSQAQRIELDFDDKAFVKERKL